MFDTIDAARTFLKGTRDRGETADAAPAAKALSALKTAAVDAGNEARAKELWCLEETLDAQQTYIQAFKSIREGSYYEGWCALERAEITLHYLRRHFLDHWKEFSLDFVEAHVERWQGVFPYNNFGSPEILEHEKECTICNQKIQIRNHCGHIAGEVYGGELALRRITKADFLGFAIMVKRPVQKYSVLFLSDPETGKKIDQYNYSVVEFVARRVVNPFHGWTYTITKQRHSHERFAHVADDDGCPCGSSRLYRECCRPEAGVLRPHVDIRFSVKPPAGLPNSAYSY